jgi:hypothetical protein
VVNTGAGFLRLLRFPLPIRIPQIAPQSPSSIIWGWYNRPNSGRSTKWTQFHPMKGEKKRKYLSHPSLHLMTETSMSKIIILTVTQASGRKKHRPTCCKRHFLWCDFDNLSESERYSF